MDKLEPKSPQPITTLESEFRREEDELRRWLEQNVTDLSVRKWYLAQQRNDHVTRGRRFD